MSVAVAKMGKFGDPRLSTLLWAVALIAKVAN
jgi:hypothetical protein